VRPAEDNPRWVLQGKVGLLPQANRRYHRYRASPQLKTLASEVLHVFNYCLSRGNLDEAGRSIGTSTSRAFKATSRTWPTSIVSTRASKSEGRIRVLYPSANSDWADLSRWNSPGIHDQTFDTQRHGGRLFTVRSAPFLNDGASTINPETGYSRGRQGTPSFGVYAASKFGYSSFARTWNRAELKDRRSADSNVLLALDLSDPARWPSPRGH